MINNYLDALVKIYSGLGNRKRLELISLIHDELLLKDISKTLDINRGSLQQHLDLLRGCGIISKDKSKKTKYILNPLGDLFYEHIKSVGEGDWAEAYLKLESLKKAIAFSKKEPDTVDFMEKTSGVKLRSLDELEADFEETSDAVLKPFKQIYTK